MNEIITCKECGTVEELNYQAAMNEDLSARTLCFTCNHWMHTIPELCKEHNVETISYNHCYYAIDSPVAKEIANKKYIITYPNGYIKSTNRITPFGEIPERFRSLYPDNAVLEVVK